METFEWWWQHCFPLAQGVLLTKVCPELENLDGFGLCSFFWHFNVVPCFLNNRASWTDGADFSETLLHIVLSQQIDEIKKAELVSVMAGISLVFVIEISHVRLSGPTYIQVSWILISPNMIFRLPKSTAKQPEENGTKVRPFRWKGNRKENKNVCELEAKRFISCFRRERQKLGKKFRDLCIGKKVLSRTKSKTRKDLSHRENLD